MLFAGNFDGGTPVCIGDDSDVATEGPPASAGGWWGALTIHDFDRDGSPDGLYNGAIVDGDCNATVVNACVEDRVAMALPVFDDPLVEELLFANPCGAWRLDGSGAHWQDGGYAGSFLGRFQGGLIEMDGALRFFGDGLTAAVVMDPADGSIEVVSPHDEHASWFVAVGDSDGDGEPELCTTNGEGTVVLLDGDGSVEWTLPVATDGRDPESFGYGSCAMADLDADGRYEVIVWRPDGLSILDGATGAVLGSLSDYYTDFQYTPPAIADVDGDGSAEIVVLEQNRSDWGFRAPVGPGDNPSAAANTRLLVFGPASGRWARTRPVRNQVGFDIVSVRDDGRIVVFPQSNPDTYNAWRAQPAHDGAHPDLVPELLETCAEGCGASEEDGTVYVEVRAQNLGSVEARAAAELVLYTWTEETGLVERASAVLTDPVSSMMASASVVLEVPLSDWGEWQVLEVRASHDDECDRVNDRIEVRVDPCAGDEPADTAAGG